MEPCEGSAGHCMAEQRGHREACTEAAVLQESTQSQVDRGEGCEGRVEGHYRERTAVQAGVRAEPAGRHRTLGLRDLDTQEGHYHETGCRSKPGKITEDLGLRGARVSSQTPWQSCRLCPFS